MDKTVPVGAAHLLNFISHPESKGDYEVISSFKQLKLKNPVTKMTLAELLTDMQTWRKQFGTLSSAAGRYQIIYKTLQGLVEELKLPLKTVFSNDLQDRLAYHLLRRRGYDAFVFGRITREEFGKRLAQEWASLPVLAGTKNYKNQNINRGSSYYAGDGLNSHGVSADAFEAALDRVLVLHSSAPAAPTVPEPTVKRDIAVGVAAGAAATVGTTAVVVTTITETALSIQDFGKYLDALSKLGVYGPQVVAGVVLFTVVAVSGSKIYKWLRK